jgi:hypothetical protein
MQHARLENLTVVRRVQSSWSLTLCNLVEIYLDSGGFYFLRLLGRRLSLLLSFWAYSLTLKMSLTFIQNVCKLLSDYTASHTHRREVFRSKLQYVH